ncbi:Glycosyl hydrolases family 43 [Streptomyces zhaozhouensis]|uniref:Glycosyl hydrolases family 43 n=1 Tax=Streptomyces zhaozhouensis TaxID=1300267 RepID=A0A286DHX2_9ACTN|nr:glycoside hydrolase 43 family protein [Streptomyces zhaozhouensis]SOD58337.1 Glycosyl hydrolases family 43 [Streptomyces zhaozhouensis]
MTERDSRALPAARAGAGELTTSLTGSYTNPVLPADWSDPDVIRVGEDFYLTASSFGRAPGLPLLHSRDLVNWRLLGHALERIEPAEEFARPRPDCGVWAPALRHHDGRFWIFWGDPDHGIQQVNAPAVTGPWTRPHLVKAGRGLIDPCPLWDDDGQAYLVHGWARSRSGVKNRLTCHRMSPDGLRPLDEGRLLVDGDRLPGWFTLEGPKLYRRGDWYWLFAPAGSVETGWQGAFRSRHVLGPYEERIVLAQGATRVNGPHQGAWVDTADGADWFLHFQQRAPFGRVVHLQPMRWDQEGWPVIGDAGEPVAGGPLPVPGEPPRRPATDDDFPRGAFGPQWSWQANPAPGRTEPHEGAGLRLVAHPDPHADDPRRLPGVLGQRLPVGPLTVEVELTLRATAPGARAGLLVLGDACAWIGLERGADGAVALVHRFAEPVAEVERDAAHPRPAPTATARLALTVTDDGRCTFRAATGAEGEPAASGPEFAARPRMWVGAQLALFAVAPAPAADAPHAPETPPEPSGHAEFRAFRVLPHRTTPVPTEEHL